MSDRPTRVGDTVMRPSAAGVPMRADRLLHPVAVVAIAALVLNDHLLKASVQSWFTGKLSDVAGLVFFPLLLQGIWELVRGASALSERRRVAMCTAAATAISFVAIKVLPSAHAAYEHGLGVVQSLPTWLPNLLVSGRASGSRPVDLAADPTDLLALPAVLVAFWIGSAGEPRRRRRLTRQVAALAVLSVASLASIATSQPPPPVSTMDVSIAESFELTADAPVAMLRIAVSLDDPTDRPGLSAHLVAAVDDASADRVRLTILPDQPGNPHIPDIEPDPLYGTIPAFFAYERVWPERSSCTQLPCARTYRLIVEALDAAAGSISGTVEVTGSVSVEAEAFPDDVSLTAEPVDEVESLARPPVVEATSEVQEATIGGDGRLSSEVHAAVEIPPGVLPASPGWPIAPELVIHVDAADDASREANAGQLVLNIDDPGGSSPNRDRWVVFSPSSLPFSVSLLPFAGCDVTDEPCRIPVDARLQAQSPGDLVSLRWWVEARIRFFAPAEMPAGATISVETTAAEDHHAAILARCEDDPFLIFAEAIDRGLIPEDEVDATFRKAEAGLWDPTELPQYEELCAAAIEALEFRTDTPMLPPSLADPSAPQASASFGPEEISLSATEPVAVREVRLTRSREAAESAGTVPINFLRLTTRVPDHNPRAFINAYASVDSLDGETEVYRYVIPSSPQAGPPLEIDPWRSCDPGRACEVELRITLLWWDYEPDSVHNVTWDLAAGVAWPGLVETPPGAEVELDVIRNLDTSGSRVAAREHWGGALELDRPGETVTRSLRFSISAGDWPAALDGVQIPAYALFTVEASAPAGDVSTLVGTDIHPADQRADRGLGGAAKLNGEATVQAFFPLRTCQGRVPCESDYRFEFITPKSLPGGPIEIRWDVELILRESRTLDLPADTAIAIESAE